MIAFGPGGYRVLAFDSIDSTNAEALRLAHSGDPGRLWIWALEQTAGRGRSGRTWVSPRGNLHASLLLRLDCAPEVALQLAFLAGLAAHDAVADLVESFAPGRIALKWPNDLLLDARKLGGILLESAAPTGTATCIVSIGTGLNLATHPPDTLRPATSLAAHGIELSPEDALERLAQASERRLIAWDGGRGFAAIRAAWERRATPIGQPIRVRLADGEAVGTYGGIDESGALRLVSAGGSERRVTAGDVFIA